MTTNPILGVAIVYDDETVYPGIELKRMPKASLYIETEPNSNTLTYESKCKMAISYISIGTLVLSSTVYCLIKFRSSTKSSNNDGDDDNDDDCTTDFENWSMCIQLIIGYLTAFRHILPCFRQYLYHMRTYEWPFQRWQSVRYENFTIPRLYFIQSDGSLRICNQYFCHAWYQFSGTLATINLLNTIAYTVGLASAILCAVFLGEHYRDNCYMQTSLKQVYILYLIVTLISNFSYTLLIRRFLQCVPCLITSCCV